MKKKSLLLAIVYIVLAAVIVYAVVYTKGFGLINNKSTSKSGWQAVFLSNGQVYFGHLTGQNRPYAELTNIYYLQVDQQQNLQPDKSATSTTASPKLTLIKLGNELHGPSDKMVINKDHILFIEDMKSDSKVVAAIEEYIKNPTK